MTPAPISILEHSPFLGNDSFNRYSIGSRDVDQKIVGGHLPLSKRNSTPTGQNSYHLEMLSALLCPSVNRLDVARSLKASLAPSYDISCNSHRRLDRSHSEPMRPQIQVQPQQQPNGQSGSSRYKTELCRPFGETGYCKYGDKCQFAHGKKELRNMTRHPKYKTELCRTFHTTGLCGYGSRCHFIHNAEERRGPMSPSNGLPTPSPSPSHITSLSSQLPAVQSSPFISSDDSVFGLTPPSSHNGSPTSNTGLFFDTPYEPLVNPVKDIVDSSFDGMPSSQLDLTPPGTPSHDVNGETELEKQRRLDIFVNITNPQK